MNRAISIYKKTKNILERTNIALGKKVLYETTSASTKDAKIKL